MIFDIILDSVLDLLKVLPFLFGAFLLIEFLEHKAMDKVVYKLQHVGIFGPLAGALIGIVPQCGFSVTAADFYGGRLITIGTVTAVFLSTSDEALLIMMSEPSAMPYLLKLIACKVVIAFVFGMLMDFIARIIRRRIVIEEPFTELCQDCHCHENHSIVRAALNHTLKIAGFLLAINLILGTVMELAGEAVIARLFLTDSVFQPLLTALIGFIPNCAASVLITQLFIDGTLSFGSAVAGLCTGAGLGLIVLWRTNHRVKENLLIMAYLYVVSVVSGMVLNIF
jgi:hypothetical protein